tara:strand:+ start:578 stop:892 length:315 start_codon:yes stop_codon:yes gene_type:complete
MPLQECDKCKKEILIYANEDNVCPHCGKKYLKSTSNQQAQGTKKIKDLQREKLMEKNKGMVLTDIDLPFSRVLWVSFQFFLASLILAILIGLTLLFFGLLVGGY